MEMPVDIFLTWVDGEDPNWIQERKRYAKLYPESCSEENGVARYRNWDNLRYVFRGIEKYLPWVRKIYLITCGQIPDFLDLNNPKVVIVNHKDYIPESYLPTFNSNTIEMNLFRIDDIADNILLFNDDIFIVDYIQKEYFIKDEKPGDEAIERIIGNIGINHAHCMINNAWIINKYFNKKEIKRKYKDKWFSLKYGKDIFRNILMNYFTDFEGLRNPHEPFLLKKEIFKKLWELEPNMMDKGSRNKFRNVTDVTQYVVRYWNIFEGNFSPRKHIGKAWNINDNNYMEIAGDIRNKKYPLFSLDEKNGEEIINFVAVKKVINDALESVLPEKSKFEK